MLDRYAFDHKSSRRTLMRGFASAVILVIAAVAAAGQTFTAASVDEKGVVRATTADGRNVKLSKHGREPQVSSDGTTVAWLEMGIVDYHGERVQVAKSLRWVRRGIRHIFRGPGFVRQFWFVDDSAKIAVNIGAMHGAGATALVDAVSGRWLAVHEDASPDPPPSWARPDPD